MMTKLMAKPFVLFTILLNDCKIGVVSFIFIVCVVCIDGGILNFSIQHICIPAYIAFFTCNVQLMRNLLCGCWNDYVHHAEQF